MDAKPHRPLRSMRTFNDENAHLDAVLPKMIHQRNKSSPALSTAAAAAGLRAAAKRTAFGDVSNTAGAARTTKDNYAQPSKIAQPSAKVSHVVQERKSSAFLRPAQRPISVASLRDLLTSSRTSNTVVHEDPHKSTSNDSVPSQQVGNVRKLLTKRNTTIYKDHPLDTVQEIDQPIPQNPTVLQSNEQHHHEVPSHFEILQDPQLRLPPPTATTSTEPVKSPRDIVAQSMSSLPNHVYMNDLPISTEVYPLVKSQSELSQTQEIVHLSPPEQLPPIDLPQAAEVITTVIEKAEVQLPPPPHSQPAESVNVAPAQHPMQPPSRTEPEEYWEDEEDAYEEEGYVTARSFRSKGENTTGGATTVLVPRVNQRAHREIEAAKQLVEATRTPEEIEDESFDTSMVAEYGDEIFEYMRQLEVKMSPNPHYMDNQHEIQWSMRSVLMDWLVQVHHRFNLLPETLFLCVNYIDRFLSSKVVSLGKLQLVGATAIFIAAKYEEINCPSVQEIVYMVDGGYNVDEILKAERFMLTMLQFELGWPGPMSFLRRISKADDYDLETRTLAKYFLEVTLMDERFIGSPPSFTAAASHCLARLMLRKGQWSPHHVYYSGYTYSQLKPLVQLLLECCDDPAKHHRAVFDKYCDKRYKRASVFVQTEIQRGFVLHESPSFKAFPQSQSYAYYSNTPFYPV